MRSPLLDVAGHPADHLTVRGEAVERPVAPRGIELVRRDAHDFHIVRNAPDDIPRTTGLKPERPPPIEQLHASGTETGVAPARRPPGARTADLERAARDRVDRPAGHRP